MINQLQVFQNQEFGSVRTIEIDGEPWLVGKDVAIALGYQNPSKALSDHVDDEDKLNNTALLSLGQRGGWLINESGLYSMVMSSQMPNAKAFKRWITHEVIPSIRKTGQYSIAPKDYPAALRALADETEKRMALEAENQVMQPKAAYFDMLIDREMTTPISYVADEFNLSQNKFIQWLINKRILYRAHTIDKDKAGQLKAYQPYIEDGWFEVKDTPYNRSGGTTLQTRFTQKGKQAIQLMLETPGTREAIESTSLPNRKKGRKKK